MISLIEGYAFLIQSQVCDLKPAFKITYDGKLNVTYFIQYKDSD